MLGPTFNVVELEPGMLFANGSGNTELVVSVEVHPDTVVLSSVCTFCGTMLISKSTWSRKACFMRSQLTIAPCVVEDD